MREPTNADRAEWANKAVELFQAETGVDAEDALCDLLCDLMHFAHYCELQYGTFDEALRRARYHYDAEVDEENMRKGQP